MAVLIVSVTVAVIIMPVTVTVTRGSVSSGFMTFRSVSRCFRVSGFPEAAAVPSEVCVLFFTPDLHCHMGSRDSAGGSLCSLQPDIRQIQAIHHIQKRLFILKQLIERGHEHVACRSHTAFYI